MWGINERFLRVNGYNDSGGSAKGEKIEKIISDLEKINGKQLRYTIFTTKEFLYRFQMRDAFIKEILTRPRNTLINKDGFLDELI